MCENGNDAVHRVNEGIPRQGTVETYQKNKHLLPRRPVVPDASNASLKS